MRPVNRGATPQINCINKTVTDYQNWRKDLIDRLGHYCSYCEMALHDSPQVEHVIAKTLDPTKEFEWENMLLACGACNRNKSAKPWTETTHYFPDINNTLLVFTFLKTINPIYNENAVFIQVSQNLTTVQITKAQNTIEMCELHTDSTALRSKQKVTDMRWKFRFDAIDSAEIWRASWGRCDIQKKTEFITLLITVVKGGFWSVWFEIFKDELLIRKALVEKFVGTANDCFDVDFNPIPRNPLNITDAI